MKILHTADWHIGKTLYKQELNEQIRLFFEWLIGVIQSEKVDVLLVSGDIFDLANPSNADKKMYYRMLHRLNALSITCIITAGNHDSPSLIEGPKDLLDELDIHVIGHGSPIERQLMCVTSSDGEKAHFLAVPFLRPGDIDMKQSGLSYTDKVSSLRDGIVAHYQSLCQMAQDQDSSLPVLAMGHLYIQGVSLASKRSERDIHIGNLAGLSVDSLDGMFDYIALGHIHRPQQLNKSGTIRYAGSPVALSFSERKDEKQVILIDVVAGTIADIRPMPVPIFRSLSRVSGTLIEVKESLKAYRSNGKLSSYIEIIVKEAIRNESIILETIALAELSSPHYKIINHKIQFLESSTPLSDQVMAEDIEDLKPRDVFLQRIKHESLSLEYLESLTEAFDEVYAATLIDGI